jgi:hypothetical protein
MILYRPVSEVFIIIIIIIIISDFVIGHYAVDYASCCPGSRGFYGTFTMSALALNCISVTHAKVMRVTMDHW